MKVFVTGGTGYVGRPVIRALQAAGHEVLALQRPGSRRPLDDTHIPVFSADVLDTPRLVEGMQGCDAVVHLVGIIRERHRQGVTMRRMHVEATRAVLTAAQAVNVHAIVHMSALCARPNALSAYHRSKWEAEELVRSSEIPYTIFRPSVIFGAGGPGPNFVQQLAQLVERSPLVPIIGDGRFLLQPVSVETVADAFVRAVQAPKQRTYELGG
ncbi:MAG: NAD-dependent epimerase/dehydratase family protein, partial [Alicyclobacillus herbarius]|uniref:SDR family oxidoreductase n=1 Tax=Alicyclobacillus herbarius TaxID=122960 RepID=UPI0023560EDA